MNWTNSEILSDRNIFVNEKQNLIPHIQHSKDVSLLKQNNPISILLKTPNINLENNINVDQHVSKPLNWSTNIHHAINMVHL